MFIFGGVVYDAIGNEYIYLLSRHLWRWVSFFLWQKDLGGILMGKSQVDSVLIDFLNFAVYRGITLPVTLTISVLWIAIYLFIIYCRYMMHIFRLWNHCQSHISQTYAFIILLYIHILHMYIFIQKCISILCFHTEKNCGAWKLWTQPKGPCGRSLEFHWGDAWRVTTKINA